MQYEILTTKTILSYVLSTPALQQFFSSDNITVNEIGDGNLNLVFVLSCDQKHLIIKQALPYVRCIGEDFPLAKERMHYEVRALQKFNEFAGEHTPEIYYFDNDMCLVAMQYLENHIIMRKGMIDGIQYPRFAEHLSAFLAEILFKTSSLYLESEEKNHLINKFNSNQLRKLTENFVFTFPYMPHATNKVRPSVQAAANKLWADMEFKKNVLHLKDIFMNKTDALLHADLHTGSIMINQDETYIIDPEFAYVGPFGFDIGALIANLVMSWISHFERKPAYQPWVLNTLKEFLTLFEMKFLALWNQHQHSPLLNEDFVGSDELVSYQREFMKNMLQESIGFAGCKIARRQLGVAGVEDIRGLTDEAAATRAEIMALTIAREFVVNYKQYQSVDDIITTLNKAAYARSSREIHEAN